MKIIFKNQINWEIKLNMLSTRKILKIPVLKLKEKEEVPLLNMK